MRRSAWPNVPRDELERLVDEWARREDVEACVVWEGAETADDAIARTAAELEEPYWLVTSDRGLRERASARAERVIGGGSFLRELGRAARRSGLQSQQHRSDVPPASGTSR